MAELNDRVVISRRVIYTQIALLATLPLTCFILGWMMGSLTTPARQPTATAATATVLGIITQPGGATTVPAGGATVLLLPTQIEFPERWDPSSIHPTSFQPLDNPVIRAVQQAGGGVVRTLEDGSFRLPVGGAGNYWLIVISTQKSEQRLELSRAETAALSRCFLPIEALFDQHKFWMGPIQVTGDRKDVGTVVIDR